MLIKFDKEAISMTNLLGDVTTLLAQYPKLKQGFNPFLPPSWPPNGTDSIGRG